MRDRVHKRIGTGVYLTAQIMFILGTIGSLFLSFEAAYPALFVGTAALSYSKFKELKPWNARQCKAESCLCKSCENFGLYEKGLKLVLKLLCDELSSDCNEEEEEVEEPDPILDNDRFKKLQHLNELDRRIHKAEAVLCEHAYRDGKMACIDSKGPAGTCKHCGFNQIWSNGLRKQLVTNSGELHEGQHPAWLSDVKWQRYKTQTSDDGKRTMYEDREGTVIDFLDELKSVYNKYTYHRYILKQTRESNTQFEHNASPGMLKLDVDWAENLTLPHARAIRSMYWCLQQVSLFICISKILLRSAWFATTGPLKAGAEVTVEIGDSFWATVISGDGESEESVYAVEDESGQQHSVPRKSLRARVWYTAAFVGVTGDKRHDSYATQHFMARQLQWWQDQSNFQEEIKSVHVHSDNAGQHFKNSKTLNFLSRLLELLTLVVVTWSFGCPGHGKGPWDCFGAVMKRFLRRLVHDLKASLKGPDDVAQDLKKHFESDKWREEHDLESKYTINRVVVQQAVIGDIERPVVEEECDSVVGIQRSFGYKALSSGVVLQR